MFQNKNRIQDIRIDVGYDDILKLNLCDYHIEPDWNLDSKTNIANLLGNDLGTFKINSVEKLINNNKKFIYPIVLFDNKLFENFKSIKIDKKLQKYIHNKKCKIVFLYLLEGYFNKEVIVWINKFCIEYNFDKEDVIMITSNLKEFYTDKFTIINYNYFGNHIQFLKLSKLNEIDLKNFKNNYTKFLDNFNKLHFLCFNGIPRLNRIMMFNELTTNKKLLGKSIVTLRGSDKNYYYDVPNWNNQPIGGGARLNTKAHLDCFINIVTETLFDEESIFLSEKTYKPIYLCQPFILFGNPYSLKKLKELGYKTFDKWWDEGYDEELDINKRFKKIVSVLEKIAEWDMDYCFNIKKEMSKILIHNYNTLFDTEEILSIFNLLKTDIGNKKSLI